MHDTLSNRGRIVYDKYTDTESNLIKANTMKYLNEEIDEFEDIDSFRMMREIFSMIKIEYKKTEREIINKKKELLKNPPKKVKSIT